MAKPYRTKGLDRASTAIKAATGAFAHNIRTGDITKGEVIEVEMDGASGNAAGTAEIRARSTGALYLGQDGANAAADANRIGYDWYIDGTTLTVRGPNLNTNTVYFWVF